MESLPDELHLLVFHYLCRFDLIYAFSNLNIRYQRLIQPYIYNIDLSQGSLSYEDFQLFLHHILPLYGNAVYSLTINGYPQLKLLESQIIYLTNLTSLTLKLDASINDDAPEKIRYYNTELFSFNTLTELNIFANAGNNINILKNICCSSISQNLCSLTLLDRNFSWKFDEIFCEMPQVKYLSINIYYLENLRKILKIMTNLIELKLFMNHFSSFPELDFFQIPETLQNLQLEFENDVPPNRRILRGFLNLFKMHLQSLTLITCDRRKEFTNFDQFQSLINNFKQLKFFQYDILMGTKPDDRFPNIEQLPNSLFSVFTLPRPQRLSKILSQTEQNLSSESLLIFDYSYSIINDYTKYHHLKKIKINLRSEQLTPDFCQRLSTLIDQAPKFYSLQMFKINDTYELIHFLKKIILNEKIRRKILEFQFDYYNPYHNTFFNEFFNLLPNLRILTIDCDEQFTDFYPDSIKSFIKQLKHFYPKLNRFRLNMSLRNYRIRNALQIYTKDLHQNTSLCYWITSNDNDSLKDLNIWL
ncbi:unnamed protein product [Adineta steineri]|uniref:F-box domain-containing protein n=1 Tax=Adineta steineri TaxID=433720 RepID=A0A813N8K7_9BILA|nr:unnamed protein product [Adineta steineri]CAF0807180.1 unnamed protein product [Adineta steineri]CAF3502893.1 unnamed protein product [Adineta steineri]CAF3715428.1 unnamed protein product [Adineta steineri]